MQPSSAADFSPIHEPTYFAQRRSSIPQNSEKNPFSMLLTGHSLTPWKSADSLVVTPTSNATSITTTTGASNSTTDLERPPAATRSSMRRSNGYPSVYPTTTTVTSPTNDHEQSQPSSGLTERIRKFSFSRQPHTTTNNNNNSQLLHPINNSSQVQQSSTPSSPRLPPPLLHQQNDVVMTNTINKDYDPATGNKVINKYMIIKEIGRGVHGKVKLAEDIETGELVAIKIVDKRTRRRQLGYSLLRGNSQQHVRSGLDGLKKQTDLPQYRENEQKIRREIAILKKCAHPHVVRLREVIDDPASRKIYMALEYMEGGEIEWRDENEMPVLSIDEARSVFRDVVSGLDYLHYQGIIHRDIKPANLLLTNDLVVKISDFGVSYFNELLAGDGQRSTTTTSDTSRVDRELAETAGTPAFFAPELCCAGDMPLSPTTSLDSHSSNHSVAKEGPGNDESNRDSTHSGNSNNNNNNNSDKVSHYRPRITKAIDVWALGVTLYCFIFGQCPFTAATEFELFDTIPTEPLRFPDPEEIGFDISDELKHLLHRLLTKNPDERITLEQVKHHPWVIEDIEDPQAWWEEADPRRYKAVEVTDEEVTQAVTIMDRLRKSIQKLSSSLSNLTHGITRRRSKSVSSQPQQQQRPSVPSSKAAAAAAAHHHQQQQEQQPVVEPLMHGKSSFSTSFIPPNNNNNSHRQQPHSLSSSSSSNIMRPISCLSDDTQYSHPHHHRHHHHHHHHRGSDIYPDLEEEDEEDLYEEGPEGYDHLHHHHRSYNQHHPQQQLQHRPSLDRQASSASSSSGLGITISRYRGGLTPQVPPSSYHPASQ
ncbi:kinase-like domain-containing protein [Zychaea mexicana]|uniref:kinase-like domain-containing protein n=1 Tax=Zychaea mexicana TaxID=64656 RepID=UPI0022FE4AB9|nr:kinase-like domain-containing protein [Zychaea mexicana]KAI9490109.1 kinase-like domain-containing protein [Zychaea mexicana]